MFVSTCMYVCYQYGKTALLVVASQENVGMVQLFLNNGTDVNASNNVCLHVSHDTVFLSIVFVIIDK